MEGLAADVLAQENGSRTLPLGQGRPRFGIHDPGDPRQPRQDAQGAALPGHEVPRQECAPRQARARGQPPDHPLLPPPEEFHTPQEVAL